LVAIPDAFLILHTAFAGMFSEVRTTTVYFCGSWPMYVCSMRRRLWYRSPARRGGYAVHSAGDQLISILSVAIGWTCEEYFQWREQGIALWGWWWVLTAWIFVLGRLYAAFLGGRWNDAGD